MVSARAWIARSSGILLVVLFADRVAVAGDGAAGKGTAGETPSPQAHPVASEPWRLRLFTAAGGIVGYANEHRTCVDDGDYACPFDDQMVSLGVQGAPFAEATVMLGKSRGFRFGLGSRYLVPIVLDEGGELHFAIVPEIVFELSKDWVMSGRFFNAIMLNFPSSEAKARQAFVDECRLGAEPSGASCDEDGDFGRSGFALSLELFLHQEFDGRVMRYGIGWQAVILQNITHGKLFSGGNPDTAPDSLSYSTWIDAGRFEALAGLEW